ncbi:MAG TPA: phage holin family protein, partial [Candidatus Methylacidiphilales bacterium]
MSSDESSHPGLFEPVRRLLQLVAQTFHVRAGLFALELREEGEHLMRLLALGAVFLFLAMAALLAVSFGVVAWFWDDPSARRTAVGAVAAVYV